jgi:hypothetical protein
MQKKAVLLGDAWACLANAATTRVFDLEGRARRPVSELMRNVLRRFNDQPVPRSNEELQQRHMQMTGLLALVGAISHAATTGRMVPDEIALMHEARRLSEMPLPATDAEFSELNVATMAFHASLNRAACCGGSQAA